jgi:hypothetical protein
MDRVHVTSPMHDWVVNALNTTDLESISMEGQVEACAAVANVKDKGAECAADALEQGGVEMKATSAATEQGCTTTPHGKSIVTPTSE